MSQMGVLCFRVDCAGLTAHFTNLIHHPSQTLDVLNRATELMQSARAAGKYLFNNASSCSCASLALPYQLNNRNQPLIQLVLYGK
jgi:hypothetical protein